MVQWPLLLPHSRNVSGLRLMFEKNLYFFWKFPYLKNVMTPLFFLFLMDWWPVQSALPFPATSLPWQDICEICDELMSSPTIKQKPVEYTDTFSCLFPVNDPPPPSHIASNPPITLQRQMTSTSVSAKSISVSLVLLWQVFHQSDGFFCSICWSIWTGNSEQMVLLSVISWSLLIIISPLGHQSILPLRDVGFYHHTFLTNHYSMYGIPKPAGHL